MEGWHVYPEGTKAEKHMTCYICASKLRNRGEMDHFPLPKRHGGMVVMPICVNCHDDKDRRQFKLDDDDGFNAALGLWNKASTEERIVLAKIYTLLLDSMAFVEEFKQTDDWNEYEVE